MARFIVTAYPQVLWLTATALVVLGLVWLLRPRLRRHPRWRVVAVIIAVTLLVEAILIPVFIWALIEDFLSMDTAIVMSAGSVRRD